MIPSRQSRNQMTESWRDRIIEIAVDTARSLAMILSCHDSVLCLGTGVCTTCKVLPPKCFLAILKRPVPVFLFRFRHLELGLFLGH
jgi:hypothetical protein